MLNTTILLQPLDLFYRERMSARNDGAGPMARKEYAIDHAGYRK